MTFTGLHVVQGFAGGDGYGSGRQPIFTDPMWSETSLSAGTLNSSVKGSGHRKPVLRLRVTADSFVSVASTPDATNGPRYLVPSGQDYDVYANAGDKIAWVAA